MILRIPITQPKGRPLRVLFYARYSSQEQDASSIPDQFSLCEKFLKNAGVKDYVITKLADAEMSGELISRPGINRVREGIANREWDLILGEDSSRLFRNVRPALELVGSAVDQEIRLIAIGDDVDTSEKEVWEDRLIEALSHHQRSNRYLAKRIRRRHDALWDMGAALGLLRSGYRRVPSIPEKMGAPAQGPFFDEIDEKWRPVIAEAFDRICRGEPTWSVAEWLTAVGLPKSGNAKDAVWRERNVIDLIRRPDYRGYQEYRNTLSEKCHATGKRRGRKNPDPETILKRDMPHLRIVSDATWHAANAVLDGNNMVNGERKRGTDHPLYGIPRDSRGPLSRCFFCGICETSKMHQNGRSEGGYQCAKVHDATEPCWNKASSLRDLTHRNISCAIVEKLLATKEHVNVLIDFSQKLISDQTSIEKRLTAARSKVARLDTACEKLTDAIEGFGSETTDAPERVRERLAQRAGELVRAQAELKELEQAQGRADSAIVSREQLEAAIDRLAESLLTLDRESGVLLDQLVERIEAVPFQQFLSNKVVLRARFELRLVSLLPAELASLLEGHELDLDGREILHLPMLVDLFEPSIGPKYGLQAFALRQRGYILEEIAKELGISKRSAHIAKEYGKTMVEAGITDPYIELTDRPANASRWR